MLQERLGHADIFLTLNTYSHVRPTLRNDAAAKMDELLTAIECTDQIPFSNPGSEV